MRKLKAKATFIIGLTCIYIQKDRKIEGKIILWELIIPIERSSMFLERKLKDQSVWINIDSDSFKKNARIYQDYEIDKETIEYALDKNERAHMDYNRENGTVVFIYNVLDLATDKEHYETIPMTFVVQQRRLITISNQDNAYVVDMMKSYTERHEPVSVYKFLFASL